MCVMSMVIGHGQGYPQDHWTPQTWRPFLDLVEAAKVIDDVTGQPDCEDPEKVAWLKRVKERLAAMEAIMAAAAPRSRLMVDAAAPLRWCPVEYAE